MHSISSDKMNMIEDRYFNQKRKKKLKYNYSFTVLFLFDLSCRRCSPFCIAMSILNSVLLAISITIIIAIVLFKFKTTRNNLPTGDYTLRWKSTGDTIAGVVNQPGTAANELKSPFDLAVDAFYTLYINDCYNHRIQRWPKDASAGTTVAGQENGTANTDSSSFNYPAGIVIDSNENIYVADGGNARVQFWPAGATSGITIAGNGR